MVLNYLNSVFLEINEAKTKAAASIFDDDDTDIFADIPLMSKAPKAKREVKLKESTKKKTSIARNTGKSPFLFTYLRTSFQIKFCFFSFLT